MKMIKRQWTDAEKWVMGIVSAILVAGILAIISYLTSGSVDLRIASEKDRYGRCIDTELLLENQTDADARGIEIVFSVDYFTERGDIEIRYGDWKEQMRTSGMKSLLPEREYLHVDYTVDSNNHKILVPHLKPKQYLHLYFGGEVMLGGFDHAPRERLLFEGDPDLMDKPRVMSVTREDGTVKIKRVHGCED
jgi:hypothetical protein